MSDLISREVKVTREEWMAYNEWGASSKLTRGACPITEAQIARVKQLRESELEKEQDELVKKAVAEALEEVAKIKVNYTNSGRDDALTKIVEDVIQEAVEYSISQYKEANRALIKLNAEEVE